MWNDYAAQHLAQQHVRELRAAAGRHRLADLATHRDLEPARPHRPGWLHLPALHLPALHLPALHLPPIRPAV